MAKWQRVRIPIRSKFKPGERQAIGEAIVKAIVNRTRRENVDKRNNPFPGYSKEYRKKKGGPVNLTLSREMLDELKVLSHKKGSILIGYDRGGKINGKVEGNVTGSYGKSPNPSKARDFLGIDPIRRKEIQDDFE